MIFKNIFGKLILMSVPIIVMYIALYLLGYLPILSDSISLDAKLYQLKKNKVRRTDIMALGSSVGLNDLNTQIFEGNIHKSFYNFSAWQLQIEDDFSILKHYFPQCKPKYVLLTSTMHDFTLQPSTAISSALDMGDKLPALYYLKNFSSIWELGARKKLMEIYTKDHSQYSCLLFDNGGGAELHLAKQIVRNNRNWQLKIEGFPSKENGPGAFKSLASMAIFLKDKNVKFIFIQAPYCKSYINSQSLRDSVNAYFIKCKTVVEGAGGTYLNYHDFFWKTDTTMFVDLGHLNGDGAMIFTKGVTTDLKKIIN